MSVHPQSPGPFLISQLQDGAFIEDSDGFVVAELYGGDGRDGQASIDFVQGNAALLASSWDLLRAVRAAAAWLDDGALLARLRQALNSGRSLEAERQSLKNLLQAAIAKAEGRDEAMINAVDSRVLSQDELRAENEELERLADDMGWGNPLSDK